MAKPKETAVQKAERELKALEAKGSASAKSSGKGRGKPAITNQQVIQKESEKALKEFKKTRTPTVKIIEQNTPKPATPAPPPPTPRQQGQQAAQKIKQAVAVKAPSAPAPVQKTLGFLSEFKPTRKGMAKTLFAAGTAALAYGGFKVYGDSDKKAPSTPAPVKPAVPASVPKQTEPAPIPKNQSTPAYSPEAGKRMGMTAKDLEGMFKNTQPKKRYTV